MSTGSPVAWKELTRHPISAEYEDVKGEVWEAMLANLRQFGILGRSIVLCQHEGETKVLDGWQLLRACIATDIKPNFVSVPSSLTAEEYVEIMNDCRRHDPTTDERIKARRERVAAARQQGQSLRAIAEAEEISPATVAADLEAIEDAPPSKVTGRNGRTYSPKPKPKAEKTPIILCLRCQRVGQVPGCKACEALRGMGPVPQGKALKFDEKKIEEAFGILMRLIDQRGRVLGKGQRQLECLNLLGQFLDTYRKWRAES